MVQQQFLKLTEVKSISALSVSSIYRMAKAGTFPKPIKLSDRSSAWLESEISQWANDRIAASRKGEA